MTDIKPEEDVQSFFDVLTTLGPMAQMDNDCNSLLEHDIVVLW